MHNLLENVSGVDLACEVEAGNVRLDGNLFIPDNARGIVVFVHGSGSSRLSPRNKYVAKALNHAGLATLLFDLLTEEEEKSDIYTGRFRFNIELLAERVVETSKWLCRYPQSSGLELFYFGASTGAAAAMVAASQLKNKVKAVVSRGGRPDLAAGALEQVESPTLLIVGEKDLAVMDLNEEAFKMLPAKTEKLIQTVSGATHLFEEAGALEQVAKLAASWFESHL